MSAQVYSPQTTFSQVTFPQSTFTPDALDFSFMDSQPFASDVLLTTDVPNTSEFSSVANADLDEQLINMASNMTLEEIQQMIDSFSVSLAALPQQTQAASFETSYLQQQVPAQIYETAINNLAQPFMIVPSQSPIAAQCIAPIEQPSSAPVASSSKAPYETMVLKAVTLLKLNMRFSPLFQKMGIVSCPDKIDLNAGMEREDALIAAGYLPQTHIPWEQALKLLGKQGFRSYYYSEMKKARTNNIELPSVPEWINRYCFDKGAGKRPNSNKKQPAESSLKNQQMVAKVMLARNNPTRRSKVIAASRKNKGKGKAVDTQRYNPYTRQ